MSLTQYIFLLQNILNNYDKARSGYEAVSAALGSMTRMAQHINEMKRKHEHAVRIQEIQSCLYGWDANDLTTYGDLVLEVKKSLKIFVIRKTVILFYCPLILIFTEMSFSTQGGTHRLVIQ